VQREPPDFSLVLGGPLYQLLRRAHLTDDALMLARRRVVVISLVAWLPLLWPRPGGQLLGGAWPCRSSWTWTSTSSSCRDPLLIAAELIVHQRMRGLVLTSVSATWCPMPQ